MKFSVQLVSRVLIAVTVLVLIVLSYFSYTRIMKLVDAANWVNHTNLVRLQLQKTYSQIKAAEAGHRGFLLTQDSAYLDPYFSFEKEISLSLKVLDSLMTDNEKQIHNLDTLKVMIRGRYEVMKQVLLDNLRAPVNPQLKISLSKGTSAMGAISRQMDDMVSLELELLKQREALKIQTETLAPMVSFGLAIFSLVVIVLAYLKINEELTIKSRMQKEMEQKNISLDQKNKELEHLAFGTSHDLQEPLRKVETYLSMFEMRKIQTSSEEKNLIEKIATSVTRMRKLVNDLLNYAQFFHAQEENKIISLNDVVRDVLHDLQTRIEEKLVTFKIENLPEIRGIQPQLYRLFLNLISNAVKFTRPNVPCEIKIACEIVKGYEIQNDDVTVNKLEFYHKISIEDNGIGFETEYKEKIFEMFQRLHNKNQYSGSGIGLAICKKVAQNHKGFISASSVLHEGSVFNIYLPVSKNV